MSATSDDELKAAIGAFVAATTRAYGDAVTAEIAKAIMRGLDEPEPSNRTSIDEVRAAITVVADEMRSEQIRKLRADGWSEFALDVVAVVGKRLSRDQIERDLPNIMRNLAATEGACTH